MGIYRREGTPFWWYQFRFNGARIRESSGTADREEAEQAEAKRKRDLWEQGRLGVKPSRVWDDAVVAYLAALPDSRNKGHTIYTLRWLAQHLGGAPLAAIDRDKLLSIQRAKTCAPATVNRVVGVVITVLRAAVGWGWIDHAPTIKQVPPLKRASRLTYASRAQVKALLAELPKHLVPMVVFALETGLRRANVTHLQWSEVDLGRKLAWVWPDQAKEGQGIAVPLSKVAVDTLRAQRGAHQSFVFVYRGQPVEQTATRAWRAACARAGMPEGFRWHDLRHTWASWHRQDGTPLHALKELGGWKDDRMVNRYAHLGAEHLERYVSKHRGLDTKMATAAIAKAKKRAVSS